jgi:predicted P-loop ATPase
LLSFRGIDTPSLAAQGEQRRLSLFNIRRDNSNAEVESVKQFVSRTSDRSRPAYGHYVVDQPRQCVFIGTTNDQEYLVSQTGNRRWWPVACGKIDIDGLRSALLQLFAEAVVAEPDEALFIGVDLYREVLVLQETRRTKDAWEEELASLCDAVANPPSQHETPEGTEYRIHTKTILEDHLSIPKAQQTDAVTKRLSRIMQRLGWTKSQSVIRVKGIGSPRMGYVKVVPLLGPPDGCKG